MGVAVLLLLLLDLLLFLLKNSLGGSLGDLDVGGLPGGELSSGIESRGLTRAMRRYH